VRRLIADVPLAEAPLDARGAYVVVFRLDRAIRLAIGALGERRLARGYHLYVGSAMGAGGLRARIERHLRREKPKRWHVDYLADVAEPRDVWLWLSEERLEREIAIRLGERLRASTPDFGSSDDDRPTHLFHAPTRREVLAALDAFPARSAPTIVRVKRGERP
jgi:Uri superfamily endonuclease